MVCLANVQDNSGHSVKEGLADFHRILSMARICAYFDLENVGGGGFPKIPM